MMVALAVVVAVMIYSSCVHGGFDFGILKDEVDGNLVSSDDVVGSSIDSVDEDADVVRSETGAGYEATAPRRIQATTPTYHPDIQKVINITGDWNPELSWVDSYSVGDRCYCSRSYENHIATVEVDTVIGTFLVRDVCTLLGEGPGRDGRPVYNDIQCGNGPRKISNEKGCPGRVDIGPDGCGQIGPPWNFNGVLHPDIVTTLPVPFPWQWVPAPYWGDSYSVGDKCYCDTTFDHGLGTVEVVTVLGTLTVAEICTSLGEGPGKKGRPIYNDVQCGNGPPHSAEEEESGCPGRVDLGPGECGQIGPTWNFDGVLHPDIIKVVPVPFPYKWVPGPGWEDSYSVGDRCYCSTTFDHEIGPVEVDTPIGKFTVLDICTMLGPGPGKEGRPVYNDIQCGNGPANNAGDEDDCPGRVDLGPAACGQIGPTWNFDGVLHPDIVNVVPVPFPYKWVPGPGWEDSYSVGDRCYCSTTFDHEIGPVEVDTAIGRLSVLEICTALGPGPGKEGRPVYNDIQCGNGPPNNAGDEDDCPGRVDLGPAACGQIGPAWNFDGVLHPDIVRVVPVPFPYKWFPGPGWEDSYSVGDRCYCSTTFDHEIGPVEVSTPLGTLTILEICALLGPGPGKEGRPLYNDIQCGNGPANNAGDEDDCPGRADLGPGECGQIGPPWNFDDLLLSSSPSMTPIAAPSSGPAVTAIALPSSHTPFFGESISDISSVIRGDVSFFNGGQSVPAGTYRIEYVDGCMKYHDTNHGWTVNGKTFPFGWFIVREKPQLWMTQGNLKLPGTAGFVSALGAFVSFTDCVAANRLLDPLILENPTEGPLGVWLQDSNYGDNIPGVNGRNPKWKLTLLSAL